MRYMQYPSRRWMSAVLLFLLPAIRVVAQLSPAAPASDTPGDKLDYWSQVALDYERDEQEKQAAADSIMQVLATLASDGEWAQVASAGALMVSEASDRQVRTVTGQINLGKDRHMYYGGVYLANERRWIPFRYEKPTWQNFERSISDPDSWYGAVYYHVMPVTVRKETYYLLFGYRVVDYFNRIKLVDVLDMSEEGMRLGKPVFRRKDRSGEPVLLNRFYLQYAAESPIKLNFSQEEDMIVMDHLMPIKGLYEGQSMAFVPDGTYDGYKLGRKGIWEFQERLPTEVLKEAPRERPVLDSRKNKDIFGRPKNR